MQFWQQPDGSFSTIVPYPKDVKDSTPCYTKLSSKQWHYTESIYSKLHWNPELPKEIQLHLFLLGEE